MKLNDKINTYNHIDDSKSPKSHKNNTKKDESSPNK